MHKRFTLLAKKADMSSSDFRHYWAGPHARLVLGMAGISYYVQNRVEKVLWAKEGANRFSVDGIVELYFESDEIMREAKRSAVGARFIPEDEPNFLRGWTLAIADTTCEKPVTLATKVMVPFVAPQCPSPDLLLKQLKPAFERTGCEFAIDRIISTGRREHLWTEPEPPTGFLSLWFDSVPEAHAAFADESEAGFPHLLARSFESSTAYLVDALVIR